MKRVMVKDQGVNDNFATLAVFEMRDGELVSDWRNEEYRQEMEHFGILGKDFKKLKPSDGQAFYDALEDAYRTSSLMTVRASE